MLCSAAILGPGVRHPLTAYLRLPAPPKPAGCDGRLQFVHLEDLAQAVVAAIGKNVGGTFNIAGDGVVMLSQLVSQPPYRRAPRRHRGL